MFFNVRNRSMARFVLILVLVGGSLAAIFTNPVQASSLIVTNANDSGAGSLRQAIIDAASGDSITFAPTLAGTTVALTSQLYIDKNLTIDGSGLNPQVILSGGLSTRIIQVASPAQVTVSNLWFQDGVSNNGGAVLNGGILIINNSTFYNNHSTGNGGAISGTNITLINSTLKNNAADGYGGAISGGDLTIRNTTITRNQGGTGGAFHITGNGTNTIVNSTIYQNYAQLGGGLSIAGTSAIQVINSTIASDDAMNGAAELYMIGAGQQLYLINTIVACSAPSQDCYQFNVGNLADMVNSILGSGLPSYYGMAELADNGGPTQTLALLPNSTLIDAGDDASCPLTDQRGISRPQGSHCDIGAYEYEFVATSTTITNDSPDPSQINQPITVSVTVTGDSPTGTVDITGADTNCQLTLSNDTGTCNVIFTSPGIKTLMATYNGDINHSPSSDVEIHEVLQPTPTNTPSSTPTFTPTPAIYTLVLQPDAAAGVDTYIYSGSKNGNYGSDAEMGVGEDNNTNIRVARSLVRFDLSSIPANATITSATLSLWTSSDLSSNTRTIRVYRLKVPFNESQVSWNRSATGVSWQVAGASGANDRESIDIGSLSILDNEALNAEKQIVLSPGRIQELVNGTFVNRGFIIVADTELNDRFNYMSSDSTIANQRPKLVVQYILSSATPTQTATITPSRTPTATLTEVSVTPSFTPTATNTVTATATQPTSTLTSTPSATHTPVWTPTYTPTATATRTFTPTASATPSETFTPSPSPTTPSGFPITIVRDDFNRANGSIGTSWSGYPSAYSITSNQLDVTATGSNTFILWNRASFGSDQEAYVTLTQIDTTSINEHRLILKSQSSKSVTAGLISVMYDGVGQTVQVWTYHSTQGWVQHGTSIPVTLVNGDQFGARARPDGTVEIYKNGTLLATRSVTSWPFYNSGGYVGLWFVNAPSALLDNFGGGTR